MRTTERITVSVPSELAERLRELADAGVIDSVSSYVAETVGQRIRRDEDRQRLDTALAARGVQITPEAEAWAQAVISDAKSRLSARA